MLLRPQDWRIHEGIYFGREPYNYVVIDDFLAPRYAGEVHDFLATDGGWSRKNWQVGQLFNRQPPFPLLDAFVAELSESMPGVIGDFSLVKHWAVACHENEGLHVHADNASVAVNLWLTPDEHNLLPGGSGLELFKLKRDTDMMVHEFNAMPWAGDFFADKAPERLEVIPYRYNRAVIFDAAIFHATDRIAFNPGSLRTVRMGLTFAFDRREAYDERMRQYHDAAPQSQAE